MLISEDISYLKKNDMAINKKNSIQTNLKVNSKGATKGLGDVNKSSKATSKSVGGLAGKMNLLKIGVAAAAAAFVLIAKKGAEFAKALSSLEAVSGATSKEMKMLSNQAKELGASTAFTASEVVSLQTELAKLGNSAKDIQKSTPAILNLAASLEVGLADAASFAGSTVNAFGLEAQDTQRIVDIMAESAASSAQDFYTLKESFTQAAPAASALGVSVEKTSALLGVLANSGITGGAAGTALKNSFIELKKKGFDLQQGLDQIANSSDKLGTAIELAGKRGGPALLILSKNQKDIGLLEDKLNGAAGAAERMAEIKLDNLAGDVTKLQSAFEGFILGIFDGTGAMNSFLRGVVQGTSDLLNFFTSSERVSDGLATQRGELFKSESQIVALDKKLQDSTLSEDELKKVQDERLGIILKMQKEYPSLLSNIDAETVSTSDLRKSIEEVNDALVNKIFLQKKQEKIDDQAEDTADQLNKTLEAQLELEDEANKYRQLAADLGIKLKATDPLGVARELVQVTKEGVDADRLSFFEKEKLIAASGIITGAINRQKIEQEKLNYQLSLGAGLEENKRKASALLNQGKSKKVVDFVEGKPEAVAEDTETNAAVDLLADTGESDEQRELRETREKKAKDKADKAREQKKKDTLSFNEQLAKAVADQAAVTEEQKIELDRTRHLEKLELLGLDGEEETAAKLLINQLYDDQEQIRKDEVAEAKKIEDQQKAEEAREVELEVEAIKLERILQNDQLTYDERERLQLDYLDKKLANDLRNENLTAEQIDLIQKKAQKAKDKVKDAEAKASSDLKDKVLEDALNGAADAFGIAQEVAVAKMIMAAPEAISGSFKEAALAYAPPLSLAMGALGAAGTVAPIIKGLADIKKNRFSKGGKTSSPAPGGTINTSAISAAAGSSGVSADTISSLSANNAARLGVDPSIGGAAGSAAANNVMGGASGSVVFSEGQYTSFQNQVSFREDLTTIGG